MNKVSKTICLIAAGLIAFGLALAGFAYLIGADTSLRVVGPWGNSYSDEWYYNSPDKKEINEKQLEPFHSIDLDVVSQEVKLEPGSTFSLHSVYNGKYTKVDYQVKDGVLTFKETSRYKHHRLNIMGLQELFLKGKVRGALTITYPEGSKFDGVTINSEAADISAADMDMGKFNIEANLGEVELTGVTGASLDIDADLGSITLEKSAFDTVKLNCSLGEIDADGFVCRKNFTAEAGMGSIDLEGELLGETRITCDLGDVDIRLRGSRADYRYDLNTDLGSVTIDGEDYDYGSHAKSDTGENYLYAENSMGDIKIDFK